MCQVPAAQGANAEYLLIFLAMPKILLSILCQDGKWCDKLVYIILNDILNDSLMGKL